MAVVGLFVDGTARPMLAGIAGAALLTLALTYQTLHSGGAAKHA
jgi:DHA1 family bicyclomycin/chloramphenicol resistance-like MFS transporter